MSSATLAARLRPAAIPVLCTLLWHATPAAMGEEAYKWKDAAGRVHYGDRAGAPDAVVVPIQAAPAPEPGAQARRMRRDRLLDIYAEDRAEREKQAAEAAAQRKLKEAKCAAARSRLDTYEHAGYLYEQDGSGERRILNDEEHAAALAKALEEVAALCK